jgi:hypothetical protein
VTVACYKMMALVLPLLAPRRAPCAGGVRPQETRKTALLSRVIGAAAAPFFMPFAVIGNVSLGRDGGDDCLGYTVLAERPA